MEFHFGIKFFKSAFDSLIEQIAVIDQAGTILFVNKAWLNFAKDNEGNLNIEWVGLNYLAVFNGELDEENNPTDNIKVGIERVLSLVNDQFVVDYPCDTRTHRRWFSMRISRLEEVNPPVFIVSHFDITERKKMEDEVLKLSMTDALTGLPNRRHLNHFLEKEWNRALRAKYPMSCIVIDIDYFKKINDRYGHLIGDQCLVELAKLLNVFSRRETDLAARLGGEEFVLLFANVGAEEALKIAEAIRLKVMALTSPTITEVMTISCGVTTVYPVLNMSSVLLIERADAALYAAKRNGRNQTKVFVE